MSQRSTAMSVLSVQTLGHYRIDEKHGAGGMGEVYRAQDKRLDRDMAIKVLSEAVAQDPDRQACFEFDLRRHVSSCYIVVMGQRLTSKLATSTHNDVLLNAAPIPWRGWHSISLLVVSASSLCRADD
ncbi:MAG: hypothetical protein GY906_18415 [bacterium]|nr:hypothetical protein [bacterium]